MKKCVIFCSADCKDLLFPISEEDYLIAADGGLRHTQSLGLKPHAILGDFDSLGYTPAHSTVFPIEKDDTDAMLAVRHGLKLGYAEFWIYGALDGPRLDHTVANFQVLQYLCDHNARGYLVGSTYLATVIQEETLIFPQGTQGILSLFCLGPTARNVTLEQVKYPMQNGILSPGFPLGVSNHFLDQPAKITVGQGSLLALWDRQENVTKIKRLPL